jgi:hypothetical protein
LVDEARIESILLSRHKKCLIEAIQNGQQHLDISVRRLQEAIQGFAEVVPV